MTTPFSDYIVYVDESGDHSLESINPDDFKLVAMVIDKNQLKARYSNPGHPYHLAMEFGLERIYRYLQHGPG